MAGLLENSANVTHYKMASAWEDDKASKLDVTFKDIDETSDEQSVGWVSISNLFDSVHSAFTTAEDGVLGFALRIDRRKVSGSVLRKCIMKAELEQKERTQVPKLPRAAKIEIRERVYAQLLAKTPADATTTSVIVDTDSGDVFLGSTNQGVRDVFESLFKSSFEIALFQQTLFTRAMRMLDAETMDKLNNLTA